MQAEPGLTIEDPIEGDFDQDASAVPTIELQSPPLSELIDEREYEDTAVSLESIDSQTIQGKLQQLNSSCDTIIIKEPLAFIATEIAMDRVKLLRLEKPYKISLGETLNPDVSVDQDSQGFEVLFTDGTTISGDTFGYRIETNGIHFYEITTIKRQSFYCKHLFIPHAAIDRHSISDRPEPQRDSKPAGEQDTAEPLQNHATSEEIRPTTGAELHEALSVIEQVQDNLQGELLPDQQADEPNSEELENQPKADQILEHSVQKLMGDQSISELPEGLSQEGQYRQQPANEQLNEQFDGEADGEEDGDSQLSLEMNLQEIRHDQSPERSRLVSKYLAADKISGHSELETALARQKNMPNLKLGDILVGEGLVSEAQLNEALAEQKQKHKGALGEILVQQGVIEKDEIQQALAKKLGIPFVNLREFTIDNDVISLLTAATALKHKVVPLYVYEGKIVVALENPMDWHITDALSFSINKYVEPVMASAEDLNWALQFYYSFEDIQSTIKEFDEAEDDAEEPEDYDATIFSAIETQQVTDNVVVKIVNKIIEDAHRQKCSDIHIEPGSGKQKVVVRFRKDGVLTTYYKFPPRYRSVFVSRIKVMAHLDISNKSRPQDGKINFRHFAPIDIELRVATIPTQGGIEDVVIRILSGGQCMPINAIGLSTSNYDDVLSAVSKPYGMFLVCGPTGSGKSTTLHSILSYLNNSERKIWTAEDPVEITQPGLRQVAVNEKLGMTFAGAMRAFLRADPDIIMVGEMRDTETAGTAIEAALTGHLVLSTLHTNSAAESIARLLDMDMDPFNFADAMVGILSQRLVKTLCPSCKASYVAEPEEIEVLATEFCRETLPAELRIDPSEKLVQQQIEAWTERFAYRGEFTLFRAAGCAECLDTGYRGRVGVHELMMNTPKIKKMILSRSPAAEIHFEAKKSGMKTRKQDGLEKILIGYTDLAQTRTL